MMDWQWEAIRKWHEEIERQTPDGLTEAGEASENQRKGAIDARSEVTEGEDDTNTVRVNDARSEVERHDVREGVPCREDGDE